MSYTYQVSMDIKERLAAGKRRQEFDQQILAEALATTRAQLKAEGELVGLRDQAGRHDLDNLPPELMVKLQLALEDGMNLSHTLLSDWAQANYFEEMHQLLITGTTGSDHPLAEEIQELAYVHKAMADMGMSLAQTQMAYENNELQDPNLIELLDQGALTRLKGLYRQERLARIDDQQLQERLKKDLNLAQRHLLEGEQRRRDHGSAFDGPSAQTELVQTLTQALDDPQSPLLASRLAPNLLASTAKRYYPQWSLAEWEQSVITDRSPSIDH